MLDYIHVIFSWETSDKGEACSGLQVYNSARAESLLAGTAAVLKKCRIPPHPYWRNCLTFPKNAPLGDFGASCSTGSNRSSITASSR